MVGFGPEDNHFVVELTYNYGIGTYQMGNDFKVCSISYMYIMNPWYTYLILSLK